jgi:hypothetical protein
MPIYACNNAAHFGSNILFSYFLIKNLLGMLMLFSLYALYYIHYHDYVFLSIPQMLQTRMN